MVEWLEEKKGSQRGSCCLYVAWPTSHSLWQIDPRAMSMSSVQIMTTSTRHYGLMHSLL